MIIGTQEVFTAMVGGNGVILGLIFKELHSIRSSVANHGERIARLEEHIGPHGGV